MSYSVKEMFLTVQGEGVRAGTVAVFLRFAGCNLWSGVERDRAAAACRFCDTDFVGTDGLNGGRFKQPSDLADQVAVLWGGAKDASAPNASEPNASEPNAGEPNAGERWVVCTGGEPLLQLDLDLISQLHMRGFKVALETNGTIAPSDDLYEALDWICVSPKADAALALTSGDELKLVYPQAENDPSDFTHLDFTHFCLQPRDDRYLAGKGGRVEDHSHAAFQYCLKNPRWRLSLQTHKAINVP